MTNLCDDLLDALATGRALTDRERQHTHGCPRCTADRAVAASVKTASRALSGVDPRLGFAARAPAIARERSARRRKLRAVAWASAAATAALVIAIIAQTRPSATTEPAAAKQPTTPATPDDATARPERAAAGTIDLGGERGDLDELLSLATANAILARADELGLTEPQRQAIREIADDARAKGIALQAEIDVKALALRRELERVAPRAGDVEALLGEIGALQSKLRIAEVNGWLRARAKLTRQQLARIGDVTAGATTPLSPEAAGRKKAATASRADRKNPATGTLAIAVKPFAIVYVDGRRRGTTPITLELTAGRHKVALVNSKLGVRKTLAVNIEPGGSIRMVHDLTRDDTPDVSREDTLDPFR